MYEGIIEQESEFVANKGANIIYDLAHEENVVQGSEEMGVHDYACISQELECPPHVSVTASHK